MSTDFLECNKLTQSKVAKIDTAYFLGTAP